MSATGLHGITQRMWELDARIAGLRAAAPARAAGPAPAGTAFDAALARATSAQAGGTAGTAAPAGAAPADLREYGNGRIPASALTSIGGGHRLAAPAAQAFEQLRAAASRDGVSIGVTDSYRSYEQQVDVARRKGLYSQGGLAAKPGTSDHGWGRSLDLDLSGRELAWMRANAGRFGWSENVAREPWHWTFRA